MFSLITAGEWRWLSIR